MADSLHIKTLLKAHLHSAGERTRTSNRFPDQILSSTEGRPGSPAPSGWYLFVLFSPAMGQAIVRLGGPSSCPVRRGPLEVPMTGGSPPGHENLMVAPGGCAP